MLQHQDEVEVTGDDNDKALVGGGGSRGVGGGGRGRGEEEEKLEPSSFSTNGPVTDKHQKKKERDELEDEEDGDDDDDDEEEEEEEEEGGGGGEKEDDDEEMQEEEEEVAGALASMMAMFPSLPPDVLESILAQHAGTPLHPSLSPSLLRPFPACLSSIIYLPLFFPWLSIFLSSSLPFTIFPPSLSLSLPLSVPLKAMSTRRPTIWLVALLPPPPLLPMRASTVLQVGG